MRAALQLDIDSVVNELGPQLFQDFQRTRIIQQPAAMPPPTSPTLSRRRSSYGPSGSGTFLTHPMSSSSPRCLPVFLLTDTLPTLMTSAWLDDTLFGWSAANAPATSANDSDGASEAGGGTRSGYVSGYTTEGDADYDEVCSLLLHSNQCDSRSNTP